MKRQEYQEMYKIIGAAMEVHTLLGRGLDELIYQEALEVELELRGIEIEREKRLNLWYKDRKLKKHYYADMFYRGLIIELKSVSKLISEHRAQLMNYMRISKIDRGVLLNFGEPQLHIERYLYNEDSDDFILLNKMNIDEYIDS